MARRSPVATAVFLFVLVLWPLSFYWGVYGLVFSPAGTLLVGFWDGSLEALAKTPDLDNWFFDGGLIDPQSPAIIGHGRDEQSGAALDTVLPPGPRRREPDHAVLVLSLRSGLLDCIAVTEGDTDRSSRIFIRMKTNRRHFLKSATVLGAPAIISTTVFGANERITVGLIGCGAQGLSNMRGFLGQEDVRVVAVCDVHHLHWRDKRARGGKPYGRDAAKLEVDTKVGDTGCAAYADYRELCARDDIDAVIVATPDHWHALATLEALRSGKDVYCEKPVTHKFREGQLVYQEVAKRKAIFQTGSQQRSAKEFRTAVQLVRSGVLGKLSRVEVGLPHGKETPTVGTEITDSPDGLDYDFWCGPGKKLPYMFARHHRAWRNVLTWGGGQLMDWIGHHNDIAHWALDMDKGGPVSVEAKGWTWTDGSVFDAPLDYEILCEYPGGITLSISENHPMGTKWTGENGWIHVTRGKLTASNSEWLAEEVDLRSARRQSSPRFSRWGENARGLCRPGGNGPSLDHARSPRVRVECVGPEAEVGCGAGTDRRRRRGPEAADGGRLPRALETHLTEGGPPCPPKPKRFINRSAIRCHR